MAAIERFAPRLAERRKKKKKKTFPTNPKPSSTVGGTAVPPKIGFFSQIFLWGYRRYPGTPIAKTLQNVSLHYFDNKKKATPTHLNLLIIRKRSVIIAKWPAQQSPLFNVFFVALLTAGHAPRYTD